MDPLDLLPGLFGGAALCLILALLDPRRWAADRKERTRLASMVARIGVMELAPEDVIVVTLARDPRAQEANSIVAGLRGILGDTRKVLILPPGLDISTIRPTAHDCGKVTDELLSIAAALSPDELKSAPSPRVCGRQAPPDPI